MNYHPRAEFWSMFAAAALSRQMTAEDAAKEADKTLAEFDKRFEWYEGFGTYWRDKTTRKP